jgi:hypothetical protein
MTASWCCNLELDSTIVGTSLFHKALDSSYFAVRLQLLHSLILQSLAVPSSKRPARGTTIHYGLAMYMNCDAVGRFSRQCGMNRIKMIQHKL